MSETIFPMSIDVANGESVTFTMTYDGRVKKHITSYGDATFLSSDDDWEFGDILRWKHDGPASEPLMFLCDGTAEDYECIWVMALVDGLIDEKNRALFERMPE